MAPTTLLSLLCLGLIYLGSDCTVPFTSEIINITYSRTYIGLRCIAAARTCTRQDKNNCNARNEGVCQISIENAPLNIRLFTINGGSSTLDWAGGRP